MNHLSATQLGKHKIIGIGGTDFRIHLGNA